MRRKTEDDPMLALLAFLLVLALLFNEDCAWALFWIALVVWAMNHSLVM